ncbi:tetratricopeptide repeat protein [Flavobacterium silvaticum]|uniref:Tetratricopeptide repeat protein n=1 Tax=Flavobacterium silvaticum TaxID=1852020 RepID=A0A972FIY3_9FLAO|nr:tetratricopeptide repeat protein [Flavobacterium silvaticum]NMH26613.1 tetratricopeptide repeat protein [Flavobacterium silvaticum]
MRSIVKNLTLSLMLLASIFSRTQNGFELGNAEYRKGNFDAAAKAYESVLASKKESVELYYNLGNSYYKMNKVAPAIFNYEKALLLDPENHDVKTNLKFAQKLQIDDVKEIPKVGFRKMMEDYTSSMTVNGWAWLSVVSAFMILALFAGYYFSWSTLLKRILFIGMGVFLLVLIVSLFAAYFEKVRISSNRPAIVFASISGVKSEPQNAAQDAFVLHEGTKVQVLEQLDDWKKVELQDGNQGWIRQADIRELK